MVRCGYIYIAYNTMASIITAHNLSKVFTFPVKKEKRRWVANLLAPQKKTVHAVKGVSFSVAPGESIALIGPNGAGKSTIIKMLTGILYPSDGAATVDGLVPWKDRKTLAYRIGTVFGQRSQLLPNLPLTDSLTLFGVMYDLTDAQIVRRIDELVGMFDLGAFIDQPVRKLSLGQRMRAEVAASLLHNPHIVFLDEPTIGLDVVAKKALRELLHKINREQGITIFLTSHDVGDVQKICDRTIVINHGDIVTDVPTKDLAHAYAFEKYIDVEPRTAYSTYPPLPQGITYKLQTADKVTVAIDQKIITVTDALTALLALFDVSDVDVYDADLETVIRHIYADTANHS